LMVTIGSVRNLGSIYKLDLWIYFWDAGVLSVVFMSGFRLFRIPWVGFEVTCPDDLVAIWSVIYLWWWWCILRFCLFRNSQVGLVVTRSLRWLGSVQRPELPHSWCSDDLEDGTVTCIHASASFPFRIHLHLTHVYPYSGYILDWDSDWETSWCQNVVVELLSVSMKPESKDRMFLIRIDIAFTCESY
jgi:hypothetical protein